MISLRLGSPCVSLLLLMSSMALVITLCTGQAVVPSTSLVIDPDLPGTWAQNLETITQCSWIIPMDLNYQKDTWTGQNDINLGAYGLVNALLWEDIPVKWVIQTSKEQDGIDLVASSFEVTSGVSETVANAVNRSFAGGPFVVDTIYTDQAWQIYLAFTQRRTQFAPVRIFKTTELMQVDVRYTLTDRPFVGILGSGNRQYILESALLAAGFQTDIHYQVLSRDEALSLSESSCITLAAEPGFHCSGDASAMQIVDGQTVCSRFATAARKYIASGGNFFAQNGGILTYEQCDNQYWDNSNTAMLVGDSHWGYNRNAPPVNTAQCPDGFLMTDKGLNSKLSASGTNSLRDQYFGSTSRSGSGYYDKFVNGVPDTPFAQYTGDWYYEDASSVSSVSLWNTRLDVGTTLNTSVNFINRAHWVVKEVAQNGRLTVGDPYGLYYASHAKIATSQGQKGGNIFYLAGLDYGLNVTTPTDTCCSCIEEPCDNKPGRRLFLNAVLTPASRPSSCKNGNKTIGIDSCRYGTCYEEGHAPHLPCSCTQQLDSCGICGGTNSCLVVPPPPGEKSRLNDPSSFPPPFVAGTGAFIASGSVSYTPVTQPSTSTGAIPITTPELYSLLAIQSLQSLNPIAGGLSITGVQVDLSSQIAIFSLSGQFANDADAALAAAQFANTVAVLLNINVTRVNVEVQGSYLVLTFDRPVPPASPSDAAPEPIGTIPDLTKVPYQEDTLGSTSSWKYYRVIVGDNVADFRIYVSVLSPDSVALDVFLMNGQLPNATTHDCAMTGLLSHNGSQQFEFVFTTEIDKGLAGQCPGRALSLINGTWYVSVHLLSGSNVPLSLESILIPKPPTNNYPATSNSWIGRPSLVMWWLLVLVAKWLVL